MPTLPLGYVWQMDYLTTGLVARVLADLDRTPGPSPYLQDLVAAGRLGMKSGEGFRTWSAEEQTALRSTVLNYLKSLQAQGI